TANAAGPAARRKRDKAGGEGGGPAALGVDRRKSKVWNYYAKLGDAYVECNICKKQLSFHNSTTTMREHLVRKHAIRDTLLSHLKEDQGLDGDYAGPEASGKRCRLTPDNGFHHPVASCPESRSEAVAELVVEMIFRDLHPLSLVKDKGFGLLLGYLEPGFGLPEPAQLWGLLWRRYGAVKRQLERYLGTAQALVLCVESWGSSQSHQSYWSVTANFIDGEWRRARCLMETQRANGEPRALEEKLVALLARFGLSGKSVFCLMHDGLGATKEVPGGWSEVRCTAHTLQLCI
ncbi:ZBED4 protein, partial [Jacana jacana]|nr:ZBED4 protein [Jacana jacana]